MSNIIKSVNVNSIKKTTDSIYVPVRIDIKSAAAKDARYIKIVVLPQKFSTNQSTTSNFPKNVNMEMPVFVNDNKIDPEEMGTNSTPYIYKNIFSKNIASNLLQTDFSKLEIYPENSDMFFDEYIVNIPKRNISINLFTDSNQENPHYFIVYCLDTNENIIDYTITNSPSETFKIEDYPDASPEFIKEAFIDEIGSSLDIVWNPLTFNDLNVIQTGPHVKINYLKLLMFYNTINNNPTNNNPTNNSSYQNPTNNEISQRSIDNTELAENLLLANLDFDITLRYFVDGNEESFQTKLETTPFIIEGEGVVIASKLFEAANNTAKRFSNSLTKIIFNVESEGSTNTVADKFSNSFIPNLYRYFNDNAVENIDMEITISYENFSYTKDISVSKNNFMQYFSKFLEFNRREIIINTFNDKFNSEVIMSDKINKFAVKLSVDKFNFGSYSLGLLNNFSILRLAVDERIVNRLYLDDNLTEDNFINNFNNNNFYINSVFNNETITDFYLKNVTEGSQIKIVIEGVEVFENSHDKPELMKIINVFPDYFSYLGNLYDQSTVASDSMRISKVDVVKTQKDFYKIFNVSLLNNQILINVNISDTINRELLNTVLDIDLRGDSIGDSVLKNKIQSNAIVTAKVFSNSSKKFLFTIYRKLSDLDFVDENTIKLDLSKEINVSLEDIKVEVKGFLLNKGMIDEFGKSQSDDTFKNKLTLFLTSLISNRFYLIEQSINIMWFSEVRSNDKIINEVGKLLDSSKVIPPKLLVSTTPKIDNNKVIETNKAPKLDLSSLSKDIFSSYTKNHKNKEGINRNILSYCLDFNFQNIDVKDVENNVVFHIKDNKIIVGRNKDKNDCMFGFSLKRKNKFSIDVNDSGTSSINVYSLFVPSFYNESINQDIINIKDSNVNSAGCIIDFDYIDIINNFKTYNRYKTELKIDKKFKKPLNFNESFYNKAKYIYNSSGRLKLKSIVNRVVLEISKKNGEKKIYAVNFDLGFNPIDNKISSNNKSNLSIDINNNKLFNPNIILLFDK